MIKPQPFATLTFKDRGITLSRAQFKLIADALIEKSEFYGDLVCSFTSYGAKETDPAVENCQSVVDSYDALLDQMEALIGMSVCKL